MKAIMLVVVAVALPLLVTEPAGAATPAGWSSDRLLSHRFEQGTPVSGQPAVTVNQAGAAVATWSAAVGLDRPAAIAVKDAHGTWSAPRPLTGLHEDGAAFAGIGGRGRAVVVWWASRNDTFPRNYWAQRQPGGRWTHPRPLPLQLHDYVYGFSMSLSGYGVVSFARNGLAYVDVIDPYGHWRPAERVGGVARPRDGTGAGAVTAMVSPTGAVTAAWQWTTLFDRDVYCWDTKLGGISAAGQRKTPRTLATHSCAGQPSSLTLAAATSGPGMTLSFISSPPGTKPFATVWLTDARGNWVGGHRFPSGSGGRPGTGRVTAVSTSMAGGHTAVWWAERTSTDASVYVTDIRYPAVSHRVRVAHYAARAGGVPKVISLSGVLARAQRIVSWTTLVDGNYSDPHDTRLRTTLADGAVEEKFGPNSTIRTVAAAGHHAALIWTGSGPTRKRAEQVRVRTR